MEVVTHSTLPGLYMKRDFRVSFTLSHPSLFSAKIRLAEGVAALRRRGGLTAAWRDLIGLAVAH